MNIPIPDMTAEQIQQFWVKVDRQSKDDCWNWIGYIHHRGYGVIHTRSGKQKVSLGVHRVAYKLHYGVDPGDKLVCHACDNRPCCNPDHLWLGTIADNQQDAARKGRLCVPHPTTVGSKNYGAKLAEEIVKEARRLWATTTVGVRKLARKYGVTHSTMRSALHRKTWKHVE